MNGIRYWRSLCFSREHGHARSDAYELVLNSILHTYRYEDWYAPGVGLVKSVTTNVSDQAVVVSEELESYSIKPVGAVPGHGEGQ